MYAKKMKKDAVSPVIAVILMVAITVVLAGVLFLLVQGMLDRDIDNPEYLQLKVSDASAGPDEDPTGDDLVFEADEPILKIEQKKGNPQNWVDYRILLREEGSDISYECEVHSIQGKAFSPGDKSYAGDTILIHCTDTNSQFEAGDYVWITISSGSSVIYENTNMIAIY